MNRPACAIGLEVHVQLSTRTKLFSASSVDVGAEVNAAVDPHCLGLPGTLPALQREAVEKALRLAAALGAEVAPISYFDRKNYFYPDLPKNYQITQQRVPLATRGALVDPSGEGSFPLQRLHLEEDAGRSKQRDDRRWIDLDRAGTPLVEIVTPPTLGEPEEAGAFLTALRDLVRWLDVSDGNMEEGSLRCDANLSLRDRDTGEPGPRVEIKNLNSIKSVVAALTHERGRQSRRRERGEEVAVQTRGFDADRGRTVFLRGKESIEDYRYFPDPDLPPLVVDASWLEEVRRTMGELPWERRARLARAHGLEGETLYEVSRSVAAADFFEAVAERVDGALAARWIRGELREHEKQRDRGDDAPAVGASALAELLELLTAGRLTHSLAKEVLARMVRSSRSAAEILDEGELEVVDDPAALEALVEAVLGDHPDQVATFRAGKRGLLGFFMGQAMRRSQGRADAPALRRLLLERLED